MSETRTHTKRSRIWIELDCSPNKAENLRHSSLDKWTFFGIFIIKFTNSMQETYLFDVRAQNGRIKMK